jgi:hypothetical protein
MCLYSIGSIEQTTNLYSEKWDVCCYLGYEPKTSIQERRLHDYYFFANVSFKHLKSFYIKHIVHALILLRHLHLLSSIWRSH